MVDLHLHSTFSDGTLTPEALAEACLEAKLTAAVLTDHDNSEGYERFSEAAKARGIRTIRGMEISAEVPKHTVHLLAYGFDPAYAPLEEELQRIRKGRLARNAEVLSRLSLIGCRITPEDVMRESGGVGVTARPHIAAALVRKGYARDIRDAFWRYLRRGAPAYAERYRSPPAVCIRLVREAGGVVVMAHPYQTEFTREELRKFVAGLASEGLSGIEVHYTNYRESQRDFLLQLAKENSLFATGGSDFHGENKPNLFVGTGIDGNLMVPDSCYESLEAACAKAAADHSVSTH